MLDCVPFAVATPTPQTLLSKVSACVQRHSRLHTICCGYITAQAISTIVNAPSYIRGRQWAARVHSDTLDHRRYCSLPMRSSYHRSCRKAAHVRYDTLACDYLPLLCADKGDIAHCQCAHHINAAVKWRRVCAATRCVPFAMDTYHTRHGAIAQCPRTMIITQPSKYDVCTQRTLDCVPLCTGTARALLLIAIALIISARPSKGSACAQRRAPLRTFRFGYTHGQALLRTVSRPSYRRGRQMAARLRSNMLDYVPFAVAAPALHGLSPIANALATPTRPSNSARVYSGTLGCIPFAVASAIVHCQCAIMPTRPTKATRVRSDTLDRVPFAVATCTAHVLWLIASAPSYPHGRQRRRARARRAPLHTASCGYLHTAQALLLIVTAPSCQRGRRNGSRVQRHAQLRYLRWL